MGVYECSEKSKKGPKMFKNVQECSRSVQKCSNENECSRVSKSIQECAMVFKSVQECSRVFKMVQRYSMQVQQMACFSK